MSFKLKQILLEGGIAKVTTHDTEEEAVEAMHSETESSSFEIWEEIE
tara:strand:- start:41 stop:181 length:141 start_codon:yes stop_codon:yes gene_type:complete